MAMRAVRAGRQLQAAWQGPPQWSRPCRNGRFAGCAWTTTGARSAATEAGASKPEAEGRQQQRWLWVAGAGVTAIAGLALAGGASPFSGVRQVSVDVPIVQVTEQVFDTQDNLLVFFLDQPEDLLGRKEDLQRIVRTLKAEESLHRIMYFYNVRKEGDPPVPEGSPGLIVEEDPTSPPLRCVMYKGQRKTVLRIGSEVPLEEIGQFFAAREEKLTKDMREADVQRVSGSTFAEDVLAASSPGQPVLLQMYEDTCFLCFLMRPFINSLAALLQQHGVPLRIKRLNIERNDFPDRCPVARGTPTFTIFRGSGIPGEKWEEFKPKELVEKLSKEYTNLPEDVFNQMDELQGLVSKRFQLFTQLVMWTMELQKLEALISAAPVAAPAPPAASDDASDGGEDGEDSAFSTLVSEMMAQDMTRTDKLHANLEHLQKEVDDVEHDAALLGVMLAESVQRREQAEEEAWQKSKLR